jgi:hypothetical protein
MLQSDTLYLSSHLVHEPRHEGLQYSLVVL